MRVMVIVKATKNSEAGILPGDPRAPADYQKLFEEMGVKSMEEAIEWVRRCPAPMPGEESVLEIRPVFEADDVGKAFPPELRAQKEAWPCR